MFATLQKFRPGMERLESREVPSGTTTETETPPPPETPPAESETPPAETETETPPPPVPETSAPPPAAPTPVSAPTALTQLAQTERFVTHLYRDVLGRQADSAGLAYWVTHLDLGTVTRGQVAVSFVTSDEYRANTIRSYYQDILGRTPDASEVDGQMGLFRAGRSQDDIRESFYASDEFFRRFNSNPSAFVAQLFSQVLKRTGSADEVNFWVNVLRTSGDRARVADSFFTSTEFFQVQVGAAYTVFLQRLPDQAGFNYWVGQRAAGQTIEVVATGIISSVEYLLRDGAYPMPLPQPV